MCAYSFFLSEIIGDIATEMSQFLYFYFLLWLISVVLIVCRFCHWSSFMCRGRLSKMWNSVQNDASNVYIINAITAQHLIPLMDRLLQKRLDKHGFNQFHNFTARSSSGSVINRSRKASAVDRANPSVARDIHTYSILVLTCYTAPRKKAHELTAIGNSSRRHHFVATAPLWSVAGMPV